MALQAGNTGGCAKQSVSKSSQQTPSAKSTQQRPPGKKDLPKGSPNVKAKVTEIETLSRAEHENSSSVLVEGKAKGDGSPTRSTLPPPPPPPPPLLPAGSITGTFAPLDVVGTYDISSLVVAINSLHGMIHTSQTDEIVTNFASGSISRSDLQGVESKINSVAAQVDSRFKEFNSELEAMKSSLEYFKVDNLRLKQRLNELEEKANLGEIKSKRFFLTIDGLLENKAKDQKTLILEKFNADANVNLLEGEIKTAKRVGKITKHKKNRPISVTVRDEEA